MATDTLRLLLPLRLLLLVACRRQESTSVVGNKSRDGVRDAHFDGAGAIGHVRRGSNKQQSTEPVPAQALAHLLAKGLVWYAKGGGEHVQVGGGEH